MDEIMIGSRYQFNTDYSDYNDYYGKTVTVLRPLTNKEAAIIEVGPMYKVKADDGKLMDAFIDELVPC